MNTTIRRFKLGDYVEHRQGSPVMRVIKYQDPNTVECIYYDKRKRIVKSYHQANLIKSKSNGLFKL